MRHSGFKNGLNRIAERMFSGKMGHQMFIVYILGGFLPLILILAYQIYGTNEILVQQAKSEELRELEAAKNQLVELQGTMITVSRRFYFDEKLEEIAEKHYDSYQEIIDDYQSLKGFLEYRQNDNNQIADISFYVENETITGNSSIVKVTDEIRSQAWYERVSAPKSGIVWAYLPRRIEGYYHLLAMSRMIRDKRGNDIGVIVLYIQPERLEDFIRGRAGNTFLVLNKREVVSSMGDQVDFEDIRDYLAGQKADSWQERVTIGKESYIITGETVRQEHSDDEIQIVGVRAYRDVLKRARRQSVNSVIIAALGACLAVLTIWLYSRRFSYRVTRFRQQMQKAAEGDFDLAPKIGSNDEISQLYDYLNTMISDIRRLLAQVYREKLHAEQLKISQKDAELKMLTSQINPHFLYNTLETIRMKARVNRQYEIEDLVKMLGKILRSSISAGEKEVLVQSELELVECYLKIQIYRFGERISYEIEVEDGLKDKWIIPLILQPLVENSIIHGLEGKDGNGHIRIAVQRQGGDLLILVRDDGCGIEEEKLAQIRRELEMDRFKGEHIGVFNVNQRLKLKYGDGYGLAIDSQMGVGTMVELRLPLQSSMGTENRMK